MRHLTGHEAAASGGTVYAQRWLPDDDAVGVVVILHGLAEHSGRYRALAQHLVARRYAVHTYDQRGHGHSAGTRAYVGRFEWLVADAAGQLAAARAAHPSVPVFLFGHSMGGAVALATAIAHPALADGLVLSAAAVGADPAVPRLQLLVGRLLSVIAPSTGILRLDASGVSRDPGVVAAYKNDPLVYRRALPARTLVALLGAMERLLARAPELALPVLVLHGTADSLVPLRYAEPVYARLGSVDRTVIRYDGLYHEVFNEPEHERVMGDLDGWLARQRSAPS